MNLNLKAIKRYVRGHNISKDKNIMLAHTTNDNLMIGYKKETDGFVIYEMLGQLKHGVANLFDDRIFFYGINSNVKQQELIEMVLNIENIGIKMFDYNKLKNQLESGVDNTTITVFKKLKI